MILVPHFLQLQEWARAQDLPSEPEQLVKHPRTLQLYSEALGTLNKQLAPFETLKRFCLLNRELQLASSEITPTMKVKRNVIAKNYQELIDSMYEDSPPAHIGCAAAAPVAEPSQQIAS